MIGLLIDSCASCCFVGHYFRCFDIIGWTSRTAFGHQTQEQPIPWFPSKQHKYVKSSPDSARRMEKIIQPVANILGKAK